PVDRWVRVLVALRRDSDLVHHAVLTHALAVLLVGWVTGKTVLRRELPILALVAEGVARPGLLDDLYALFEDLTGHPVDVAVDFGVLRSGGVDAANSSVGTDPAALVPASEADIEPPLEHVVERGDLLGGAHRVVRRQHVAERRHLHPLGVHADEQAE